MLLATHEIVGQSSGLHLLITGGVHGDEFEPMAAVRQLKSRIDSAQLTGRVTLVPVVNFPAFEFGNRTAPDGADLARMCPGKLGGTVTEEIAFRLTELIRTANLYVDLHTGGTHLMVLPLSGYMLHPNPNVLAQQRRMAHALGLPVIWGTDPRLNGRSLSVARDANVPAIYAEYEGGGRLNPLGVDAYVHGCLNIMHEFGMLAGAPTPIDPPPLVVEDDRPGSGHMQLNHPAPMTGFFEAAVKLGDRVQTGDTIGTVQDVLGNKVLAVRARYGGLVIVLHTFARVDAGVSVAVILETT